MANKNPKRENLKPPFSKDDPNTARKAGRNGAIKTNQIKREKKKIKEILQLMLSSKLLKAEIEELKTRFPELQDEDMTYRVSMAAALFQDLHDEKSTPSERDRIFRTIVDYAGEKPVSKISVPDPAHMAEVQKYIDEVLSEEFDNK